MLKLERSWLRSDCVESRTEVDCHISVGNLPDMRFQEALADKLTYGLSGRLNSGQVVGNIPKTF